MYKLVIVDDEPTVRYGLRTYFDWSAYGFEVIGEADDGDVGLELVDRVKPDLVLSDVIMPHMDGIRMSAEIKLRYPHTKVIFVSGHDDAEYLKSALQVNAVDYIFKPVNMQELRIVVERVIQDLQMERQQRKRVVDMQVKLTQSLPLLREKFLMSVIRDDSAPPTRIQERLAFLELNLPLEGAFWVVVVSMDDHAAVMESRSERDNQLLAYSVLNICQELIESYMNGYAFENQTGEFVGILWVSNEEHKEDQLFTLASAIRDNLLHWLKLSATIGLGERAAQLSSLSHSYRQAREAADQKWYLGKNHIISMDNLENNAASFVQFSLKQSDHLISTLKAADPAKLAAEIKAVFEPLARNRLVGFKYCRNVALQLILLASRLMLELNIPLQDLEEKESELWERVFKQETVVDLRQLVENHLNEICMRIGEKRKGKSNNVVERIRTVMDLRFAENLLVEDIAKEVYLTSTYVCLLFKQETGLTINEYLTHVRVERAKVLLQDPRNKFYEISEAVGYADPSYFSKLFKKHTGLTPSDYRDKDI